MKTPYSIFLHTALVVLAAFCILLVQQNGQMRQQLTPDIAQLEASEVVEAFEAKELNGEPRILDGDNSHGDRLNSRS